MRSRGTHEARQNSQDTDGLRANTAQYLAGLFKRGKADEPAAAVPSSLEHTNLDIHKGRVAVTIAAFFHAVDARVGEWIGYEGSNIRDELRGRLVPIGLRQHRIDTVGMQPALRKHVVNNRFLFKIQGEDDTPEATYKIDCQGGGFLPSVEVAMPDGSVETTLFIRHEAGDAFHHVRMRRVYGHGDVRYLTTFAPHPLLIEQGTLTASRSRMIYEDVDPEGNVSLLDGQVVSDPTGSYAGKYSAAEPMITPVRGSRFPYEFKDEQLTIGNPGSKVRFPLQTNIYAELENITQTMPGITA
ncbi:MAG TPA: hypothetical protein VLG11_01590 [Candidatus Saccharimonadales bacterium]|nr:hypothetical protein [Candidatus Saccharimonadales bacterium]